MAAAERAEGRSSRSVSASTDYGETIARTQVSARRVNTLNVFTRSLADPGYALKQFPLAVPELPATSLRQPSRLLSARYRVVPFSEREPELRALAQWRDDPGLGTAVRLLHGPGGEGKTRLAAEFASASAWAGWEVSEPIRDVYGENTVVINEDEPARPRLLIVDYAERWPPSDLMDMVHAPMLRDAHPLRILLLARPAGSWWESLEFDLGQSDIATDEMLLAPLATDLDARVRMFTAARAEFARILGIPDDDGMRLPASVFTNDAFRMVLTIHMAALAAVHAAVRKEAAPADPVGVSGYLLQREREHWRRLYRESEAFGTRPEVMARAVYTAILTHQVPYDVGITLLDRVGIATSAETASQVLDDHAVCYPPTQGVLEPLYPDRLAEDFIALQTPGLTAAGQQDQWAVGAAGRLLSLDRDQPVPQWADQAMTVLIEVSRRWPHFAERQLGPLLLRRPWLAVSAGGQALSRLAGIHEIDASVLAAVESTLPAGARVDLDAGIAEITARLAADRLANADDDETRGDIYRNLGWRQANAGLFEEAAQASDEAAWIFAALTPSERIQSKLAQALHDLGQARAELDDLAGAHTATKRAVSLYRQLVAGGAQNLEGRLAESLTDHGRYLWLLGDDVAEALAATKEAVAIYRRLVSEPGPPGRKAAKRQAQLARSLTNQGTMLIIEDAAAALAATQEAADILTALAAADPPGYELDLAMALDNLGTELANQGADEAAVAATERAVAIGHKLALLNPAAVEPKLAFWTRHLGTQLLTVGRVSEGVQALADAVVTQRNLAQASPAAHRHNLPLALTALANGLISDERPAEAVPVAKEALSTCRALTQNRPGQEAVLANALTFLAEVRVAADTELAEALDNVQDATVMYQALAAEKPVYRRALANAISLTARLLARLGRAEEAAVLRDTEPDDLPAGPWLEALRAEPVGPVEDVLRAAPGAVQVARAISAADVYVLHSREADNPDSEEALQRVQILVDGSELSALPIFTNSAAIQVALTRIAGAHRLAVRRRPGSEVLAQAAGDLLPVLNPWTELQYLLNIRDAVPEAAEAEVRYDDSFGLEHVEAVLREARRHTDQAQLVRAAIAAVEVYALGHTAGDTSVLGHGTEADLLHFAIDVADREVTLLPIFTNAAVMREALLRNPDWQQLSVLTVRGDQLLDNVDDDVVVVVNPWSDLEFQIPMRLAG